MRTARGFGQDVHRPGRPGAVEPAQTSPVARATDGAFDPTVGPVVGRFGYGPITNGRSGLFDALQRDALIFVPRYTGSESNRRVYFGLDALNLRLVPEPSSAMLLALGGLAAVRRRR